MHGRSIFEGLKRAKRKNTGNKYGSAVMKFMSEWISMKHKFCASVWRCMAGLELFHCFLYRLFTHPFIAAPDRLFIFILSASVVFETCVSDAGDGSMENKKDIRPFPVRCGWIKRFQKVHLPLNSCSRYIIISDCHRGRGRGQMIIC